MKPPIEPEPEPEIVKMIQIQPPSPEVANMMARIQAGLDKRFEPVPSFKPGKPPSIAESGLTSTNGLTVTPFPAPVAIAVIAPGQVIEWTKGRAAGCLGHIMLVEEDGVVCVQQPCEAGALRWFKVPNGEFKVIGSAAGRYSIPDAEIAKRVERLKPKKREEWDMLQ